MFEPVVISHANMLPGEAAIIQQLFVEELACFHLRKPDADEQVVRSLLDAIPATYHHRIALHGFHHLADDYDIRRLHFTEQHRAHRVSPSASWRSDPPGHTLDRVSPPKKGDPPGHTLDRVGPLLKGGSPWDELKEKGFTLSTSVHELQTLQQLPASFSYAFFSPVFDSISKQEYRGVTGDDFYLQHEQKPVPVIALGGINAANIQQVADMNFDGAAVLGAIWNEPDNAVERWIAFKKAAPLPMNYKAGRLQKDH